MARYETYIPQWDAKDDWYAEGDEYSSPEDAARDAIGTDEFDSVVFVREPGKPETTRKFHVVQTYTATVDPVE